MGGIRDMGRDSTWEGSIQFAGAACAAEGRGESARLRWPGSPEWQECGS